MPGNISQVTLRMLVNEKECLDVESVERMLHDCRCLGDLETTRKALKGESELFAAAQGFKVAVPEERNASYRKGLQKLFAPEQPHQVPEDCKINQKQPEPEPVRPACEFIQFPRQE